MPAKRKAIDQQNKKPLSIFPEAGNNHLQRQIPPRKETLPKYCNWE